MVKYILNYKICHLLFVCCEFKWIQYILGLVFFYLFHFILKPFIDNTKTVLESKSVINIDSIPISGGYFLSPQKKRVDLGHFLLNVKECILNMFNQIRNYNHEMKMPTMVEKIKISVR